MVRRIGQRMHTTLGTTRSIRTPLSRCREPCPASAAGRRLSLTDNDRRRLAVRAYRLGRRRLREIATIVKVGNTNVTIAQRFATQVYAELKAAP
jgi:hypothetical protein